MVLKGIWILNFSLGKDLPFNFHSTQARNHEFVGDKLFLHIILSEPIGTLENKLDAHLFVYIVVIQVYFF